MEPLLWLFSIPLLLSGLAFVMPRISPKNFKAFSLLSSLIPMALLLFNHPHWIGAEWRTVWFSPLSIEFYLKVDSLTLLFLYLVSLVIPVSIASVQSSKLNSPATFYGLVFLLEALLIGFFTARDLALFAFFWEGMLIPLYFLINLWGGPEREKASLKFLLYMIAGSCLLVAAILSLFFLAGLSFDMDHLASLSAKAPHVTLLFFVFLLAFAVKTPLFPFHAWLPDAYTQASVPGAILLSAVLSKAGIYGILRVGHELFPEQMAEWNHLLLGLAMAGAFYGAFAAWMQRDFKKLIAYSSFSHVNFVLVGLFALNVTAQQGAILQAINHGITIAALFLLVGWLENRLNTTTMGVVSGMANYLPKLCWLTLFFALASVAIPGTNNFIGEFMILFGLFSDHPLLAAFLGTMVIFSAVYMLRFMQKIFFEKSALYQEKWVDIGAKEVALLLPLIVLSLWIGLYPTPVLKLIADVPKPNMQESR